MSTTNVSPAVWTSQFTILKPKMTFVADGTYLLENASLPARAWLSGCMGVCSDWGSSFFPHPGTQSAPTSACQCGHPPREYHAQSSSRSSSMLLFQAQQLHVHNYDIERWDTRFETNISIPHHCSISRIVLVLNFNVVCVGNWKHSILCTTLSMWIYMYINLHDQWYHTFPNLLLQWRLHRQWSTPDRWAQQLPWISRSLCLQLDQTATSHSYSLNENRKLTPYTLTSYR